MKKLVALDFPGLAESAQIELDDADSPATVRAIIESLPIKMTIERWGDELYSEPTPVRAGEENAKSEVKLFDVAYWPEGNALCFFYGHTPMSKEKILPYSPVNVVGRIKTRPKDVARFLDAVERAHVRKKVQVVLR
ncbi:cyclophilin-like fold protein [Nitrososphaera sp.]|uniref:cyclophilin-like fold protein n=1 Tax=Nitrososphaera sp. TaxID=1971748 RepID=UPI0017D090F3|nr:cyclophilin-like fold protein [Nitrososphaera sp.]NWG38005.1 hypothetical protein [Nitrososphaera sp.]